MRERSPWRGVGVAFLLVGPAFLAACGGGRATMPDPRPIVIHSGARVRADRARMEEVDRWVQAEQENIEEDPTFLVRTLGGTQEVYPWDLLEIRGDTVDVPYTMAAVDTRLIYEIYGHLHLMVAMDRQAEWLPEAPEASGYDLERAILVRAADAWLLGRTVWGTSPYGPLDELMYANEGGHLDAFIFTARPDQFVAERASWVRENPEGMDLYRRWFLDTFRREPPGLR
ncbi:MAG: hypothetical protein OEZ65_13355 [Gemmatimonadota bacterium]|nr:hypothetical protein [Gemmatimonadota bacterium]MDH5760570.1 hypothetical protein [Gemmatimonadota bacterium]